MPDPRDEEREAREALCRGGVLFGDGLHVARIDAYRLAVRRAAFREAREAVPGVTPIHHDGLCEVRLVPLSGVACDCGGLLARADVRAALTKLENAP